MLAQRRCAERNRRQHRESLTVDVHHALGDLDHRRVALDEPVRWSSWSPEQVRVPTCVG